MRRAFTAIEILTVIAILIVLAALSLPFLRNYLFRSDLSVAAEQTNQMLRRAVILSQSGVRGEWGVYVPEGILYQGESFATRDTSYDEVLPLPPSISVAGIQDVRFSPLYGIPNHTGMITLEATNGDSIDIPITGNDLGAPNIVSSSPNATIQLTFLKIKNYGHGDAHPTVYVGEEETPYEENAAIPLTENGQILTDSTLQYGVTGLAVQRTPTYIRVLAYGALPDPGSKELVDARITLQNASVTSVLNDEGEDATENPFDGNVNEGVGGDEVTQEGSQSVLFQSRVTNAGDSILIFWEPQQNRLFW